MRLLLSLLFNALALIITAYLVPGFRVADFQTAILATIVLGIINIIIKPILLLLTAPINLLTLGLFTFVVNAVILFMVSWFVKGLTIDGWLPAILAAIVFSVVSTAMSMLLSDFKLVSAKKKK